MKQVLFGKKDNANTKPKGKSKYSQAKTFCEKPLARFGEVQSMQ